MKLSSLLTVSISALSLIATNGAHAALNSAQIKAAVESQTMCESFVRHDDRFVYFGFGWNAKVRLVSVANPSQTALISAQSRVMDVVRTGDRLWVLTDQALEEFNLEDGRRVETYSTYQKSGPFERSEGPTGLALTGDVLVISHGRLGFSMFKTTSRTLIMQKRLVPEQAPRESMATSVTVQGDRAIFVLDNYTLANPGEKPAFRGFVVVNLKTTAIEHQLDGLDPGADSVMNDGQKLIVQFMGSPIWKYGLNQLATATLPSPLARVWQYPVPGRPTGRASMDDVNLYTCFLKRAADGTMTTVPMVIERVAARLD